MSETFKSLGISEEILKSLNEMEYHEPTEVQKSVIPHIIDKKDLIVMSKTGSGKTGAFGITMVETITKTGKFPKGLVLTPTRELAVQVDAEIKRISKHSNIKTTAVYGQHNMNKEIETLKKGVSIITGTPGRVIDHIERRTLRTDDIEFLVLDEADRMLDMGFIDQVKSIIKKLPRKRVTLLFSATMPDEIKYISRSYMKDPIQIEFESDSMTVDSIDQLYYRVERNEKRKQLDRVINHEQPEGCMVFCNTRIEVDKVNDFLNNRGFLSKALHGANTQASRMKKIDQFKRGRYQVLVATDVAARGLHIENLPLVINYDLPVEKDNYVHRIGRTGRAGKCGKAISLVTSDDLFTMYEIEEHVGVMIEEEDLPTDEMVKEGKTNALKKWEEIKAEHEKNRKKNHNQKKSQHSKSRSNQSKKKPSHHTGHKQHQKPKGEGKSTDNRKSSKHHSHNSNKQNYNRKNNYKKYNKHPKENLEKTQTQNKISETPVKPVVEAKPVQTPVKKKSFIEKITSIFKK